MKKVFSLCLICFLAVSAMAQRAAVMEFKAGSGISQADVDGISGIFTTYFRPAGYTMIERTQIDRIIEEQRLQRSTLTESQMVRVGQLLNLSKIVIGDVNIVMGQYNVDVRVINVESGTIAATEGATFAGSSYREVMKNLAQKLAGQIAIGAGPTINAQPTPSTPAPKKRTSVETVYGYLHVFPNELGVFQSHPNGVIANINNQGMHGYDEWRVPTNEELSLLRANGYLSDAQYMSEEHASGMVLLVTTGASLVEKEAHKAEYARIEDLLNQGYVDLGLPSGTWWKNENEGGRYGAYIYEEAEEKFGNNLPTQEQFAELKNRCSWLWLGDGYKVVGLNGNFIIFQARGYEYHVTNGYYMNDTSEKGYYWSSSVYDNNISYLYFTADEVRVRNDNRDHCGFSVRLVQKM